MYRRLLFLALAACSPLLAAERPNVLLILLDDLGYSDLGAYGGEIPTPHIDALAKGGVRFTQMANSARCCPSRASLLTGIHPAQAGIPNFAGVLSRNSVTLAEVLRPAGYKTYAVGKWHVGNTPTTRPTARGFDEFYGFPAGHSQDMWTPESYVRMPEDRKPEIVRAPGKFYATDVFTDYALEFLRQAQGGKQPWFLYLAYSAPHFPIQAPRESAQPFVETYRKGWDALRAARFDRMKQLGIANHEGWQLTPRSLVPVEAANPDIANGYGGQPNPAWDSLAKNLQEDLAHRMALYAAMVKHVDGGIGRIVAQLKQAGTLDNTLILFLSDNGACYEWGPLGFDGQSRAATTTLYEGAALETMGGPHTHMSYGSAWANLSNTPFRLYKHFTHAGGILTPFIAYWPRGLQQPNRWVRDPAHIIDVMPTLLELTGATYPKEHDGVAATPPEGVSLAATLRTGAALPERALCFQHEGAAAIQKGRWKLVKGKRFPTEAQWELYDVQADPVELNDLAAKQPALVKSLAAEWTTWAERTGTPTSYAPATKAGKQKKKAE